MPAPAPTRAAPRPAAAAAAAVERALEVLHRAGVSVDGEVSSLELRRQLRAAAPLSSRHPTLLLLRRRAAAAAAAGAGVAAAEERGASCGDALLPFGVKRRFLVLPTHKRREVCVEGAHQPVEPPLAQPPPAALAAIGTFHLEGSGARGDESLPAEIVGELDQDFIHRSLRLAQPLRRQSQQPRRAAAAATTAADAEHLRHSQ